jgi:hypothetical protein
VRPRELWRAAWRAARKGEDNVGRMAEAAMAGVMARSEPDPLGRQEWNPWGGWCGAGRMGRMAWLVRPLGALSHEPDDGGRMWSWMEIEGTGEPEPVVR